MAAAKVATGVYASPNPPLTRIRLITALARVSGPRRCCPMARIGASTTSTAPIDR